MLIRTRHYGSFEEAAAEWRRLNVEMPVDDEMEFFASTFLYAEGGEKEQMDRLAFLVEELGGSAVWSGSEKTTRLLIVSEPGLFTPAACPRQGGQDDFELMRTSIRRYQDRQIEPLDFLSEGARHRTAVMGVLNVTPDSFSDGGRYSDHEDAVKHALDMVDAGADVVDIGGESTRPGASPVSSEVEARRILPVIRDLAPSLDLPISVDTRHPDVARQALDAGARIINDVSGLRDDAMIRLAAESQAPVVVMHMLREPATMQLLPDYEDVVGDICLFLQERTEAAISAGVKRGNIMIDPGLGFGKTVAHNLEIIRRLREYGCLGFPLLVGPSRKAFIGKVLAVPEGERLEGTLAAVAACILNGARIVRVHDVKETVRVARLIDAVSHAR
jgi:dihydropteroate synthase